VVNTIQPVSSMMAMVQPKPSRIPIMFHLGERQAETACPVS